MLLNYILDEELRPYSGVDISGILDIDSRSSKAIIELWVRTLMVFFHLHSHVLKRLDGMMMLLVGTI